MILVSGLVALLASILGTTQPALRLLLSILAGYPIAGLYRSYVVELPEKIIHHLYFALSGCMICYFNYGNGTHHSLIAISVTYAMLKGLYAMPKYLIASSFLFHMTYLTVGYYYTETDEYDILWTMPHCVLVLRLIGLAFDVADGQKSRTELSQDQKEFALRESPTIFELFGYAYFPQSFLIGPQFPFSRYKRFIAGEFRNYSGSGNAGSQRFMGALIYLTISMIGSKLIPNEYLLSNAYRLEKFPVRLILLGAWGKVTFCRYIACWMLTEGALMYLGFSYNGNRADGSADWSGCSNVQIFEYETGLTLQHYVNSLNTSTNHWVAHYVYKRLKSLDKRILRHLITLLFLAAWHGLHSGYYVTFLFEFIAITAERQMSNFYETVIMPKYGQFLVDSSIVWEYCCFIILKTYDIIMLGFGLVPFVFLNSRKWMRVYGAVYYCGFIFMGVWFVFYWCYRARLSA